MDCGLLRYKSPLEESKCHPKINLVRLDPKRAGIEVNHQKITKREVFPEKRTAEKGPSSTSCKIAHLKIL